MTRARILADYVAGGTTAAEFDYMDGVTSNVQTQMDAKLPLAGGTMTGNIVMGDDTSIGISDSDERIEFDAGGDISVLGANLGIGETTPSGKLHVVNGSGITLPAIEVAARNMGIFEGDNSENYIVTACPNDSSVGLIFADPDHKAAGAIVYAHADNHIRLVTNASERMRIDSSGNTQFAGTNKGREWQRVTGTANANAGHTHDFDISGLGCKIAEVLAIKSHSSGNWDSYLLAIVAMHDTNTGCTVHEVASYGLSDQCGLKPTVTKADGDTIRVTFNAGTGAYASNYYVRIMTA